MSMPGWSHLPRNRKHPSSRQHRRASFSYPMLLGSSEQTVYLDVSDEEILLWDNASGGQLIAVAKYAQAMQGAQDALQSCDFTDLDGDGSSELTAIFRFPDGTNASLVWFYTDGSFVLQSGVFHPARRAFRCRRIIRAHA